jgi:hypothetical protein
MKMLQIPFICGAMCYTLECHGNVRGSILAMTWFFFFVVYHFCEKIMEGQKQKEREREKPEI